MKAINKIRGLLPHTERPFEINLNGRNLLIVGGNGSGKTSFLEALFATVRNNIAYGNIKNISVHKKAIEDLTKALSAPNYNEEQKAKFSDRLKTENLTIQEIYTPFEINYSDHKKLISGHEKRIALINTFPANRKAQISDVHSAMGSKTPVNSMYLDQNLSSTLEQHLVNLHVRSALSAYRGEKESQRAIEIKNWFESFTKNLRFLFEDDSTNLIFDADQLRFRIRQKGKKEYPFQTLSSGYLAIFDIYADLLMRTEHLDTTPANLSGIVIIDEIDVHLHISLQRKIFPFLCNSFPNIQFIASTHSPFVVTSVDDALIYDLSTGRESSDMSMYSIDAVVEGLLGVPSVSKQLEKTIKDLANVTSLKNFKVAEAESILAKLSPHADSLDAESRMFYEIAVNKVIKQKAKGV
jgi:predicted ATP-binding protein involved in virulence